MNHFPPQVRQMQDIMSHAKSLGILHGHFSDYQLNGQTINLNGQDLHHFANCSYLGLELDQRLKNAAKDAIERYGIQFSSSRTYLESGLYEVLEDKLSQIFGNPVIVAPTTSLGHISWIPNVVHKNDAVILDHQVHRSVQNATMIAKANGTHVELLRHNRMDLLEDRIIELSAKYRKVWYMADGVYSMFGDVAPMQELYDLLNRHEQFHLYVDDAHGMSWAGKHGRGYALSNVDYYHEKMCLITSINKGFGANGSAMVFSDEIQKAMIKNAGSTLIFSGPVSPVMLTAGIASADIHLSDEIYDRQNRLTDLIKHFNQTAIALDLPLVRQDITPICYLAVGANPLHCVEIAHGLQQDGYFVNVSSFPTVPLKNSGMRITLNTNHTEEAITGLLNSLKNRMDEREIVTEEVLKPFVSRDLVVA
ncbi:glycine C-acetyltransferase [Arcicella aurantiaca]|uniref:Glycine C-acetyltransferase n=1 Tax=Arcicella aurantiaca TaxID=591202 RepID=A0A316DY82_9BACT|nr:aminotransferase class I/II-fold pyridoxal phosphate-dependent enzyme [Arcicella aurantiaca]PWK23367.1 glycine C-acetyltransferase [Arcicella aurantiaca]